MHPHWFVAVICISVALSQVASMPDTAREAISSDSSSIVSRGGLISSHGPRPTHLNRKDANAAHLDSATHRREYTSYYASYVSWSTFGILSSAPWSWPNCFLNIALFLFLLLLSMLDLCSNLFPSLISVLVTFEAYIVLTTFCHLAPATRTE